MTGKPPRANITFDIAGAFSRLKDSGHMNKIINVLKLPHTKVKGRPALDRALTSSLDQAIKERLSTQDGGDVEIRFGEPLFRYGYRFFFSPSLSDNENIICEGCYGRVKSLELFIRINRKDDGQLIYCYHPTCLFEMEDYIIYDANGDNEVLADWIEGPLKAVNMLLERRRLECTLVVVSRRLEELAAELGNI